jgi:excisionase family DNA binding protein
MSEYLTVEQVAERLGVEYKTVYKLIRSGEIPAGKIGRVYRILSEDLDAFFEASKKAVADQAGRSGLAPLQGLRCGACGETILSKLSVGGECEACGGEICQACWSIRKTRQCVSHDATAGVRDTSGGGAVSDGGEIVRLRRSGALVVTAAEALEAEEQFIRAFGERVGLLDELPDPLSGEIIVARDARVRHQLEVTRQRGSDVPGNRVSRFAVRTGGWGKPKAGVVLEGRFFARPAVLKSRGYDTDPIDEAELTALLKILSNRAERSGCFNVVLAASPTGWSQAAGQMIVQLDSESISTDRNLGVVLWGSGGENVFINESDERLRPFGPLVAPDWGHESS